MRYRARGVALLQKLLNHATVPGLAARALVIFVEQVVQKSVHGLLLRRARIDCNT